MPDFTLILGNKNYSSWSLRAWLCARQTRAPFEEVVLHLEAPDIREQKAKYTPAGRVPVLTDGDLRIWDSLAIAEYLAERYPGAGLWPEESRRRAWARSLASEMHSGFVDLRNDLPMNIRSSHPDRTPADATRLDIQRIQAAWRDCRAAHRDEGPFLFGSYTIADAFYAPVVTRFRTYAVPMDDVCQEYADAVWQREDMQNWAEAARNEPWVVEVDEV